MQFHASSLADAGYTVDLVGYPGAKPYPHVRDNPHIQQRFLRPWQLEAPRMVPRALLLPFKAIWQFLQLFFTLLCLPRPNVILVQNPPAIPTLLVAKLVSVLRCCRFVIDWHNIAYSLLGLSLGASHWLVRMSRIYERVLGKTAHANLCVTHAMREELAGPNWRITATTLHDRPPHFFRRLRLQEMHELLLRLEGQGGPLQSLAGWGEEQEEERKQGCAVTRTLLTQSDGKVSYRARRPALLITSTSWTPDEDLGLLIHAIQLWDERVQRDRSVQTPKLVAVITGRGPERAAYERRIAALQPSLKHSRIVTCWLAAADYPKLLGCADLGVSLHTSSSGLDLPMKVVDMFGCGLPVCAVDFKCLPELVRHEENGLAFTSSQQLADQLMRLLHGFPSRTDDLDALRKGAEDTFAARWSENWTRLALPLIRHDR